VTSSWSSRRAAAALGVVFGLCFEGTAQGETAMEPVAGVRAETAVGVAPLLVMQPDGSPAPSRPTFMLTVAPMIGWHIVNRRISFSLEYTPRLRMRRPNLIGLDRPLLLHGVSSHYSEFLSRRVQLASTLTGQYGELDYTGYQQLLEPSQSTSAYPTVLKWASISGNVALSHAYMRRHRRQIGVGGQRQVPMTTGGVPRYRTLTTLHADLGENYVASRRDQLDGTVMVGSTSFGAATGVSAQRFSIAALRAHWQRRLSPSTTLDLGAGVHAALGSDGRLSGYPLTQAAVAGRLNRRRALPVTGHTSLALDAVPDWVRGIYMPIMTIEAGVAAERPGRWTAQISVRASTTATLKPYGDGRPQSTLSVQAPVVYRLGSETMLEVGARAGVRASHWAAPVVQYWEKQAWLYVAIAWATQSRHHVDGQ
jgi:hypothetical protein